MKIRVLDTTGCQSSLFDKKACEEQLEERLKEAKVLHYTGPYKPWYDARGIPEEKRARFVRNQEIWKVYAGSPRVCDTRETV